MLQLPQNLHISVLGRDVDTGQTIVVPDLGHFQHRLHGGVLDDLLQGPRGAELGSNVERGVPFVVGDVNRGSGQKQLPHDVQLLQVRCQVKRSLWEGEDTEGQPLCTDQMPLNLFMPYCLYN